MNKMWNDFIEEVRQSLIERGEESYQLSEEEEIALTKHLKGEL
tara:strand:- start:277 stop:405 length:129 start_codon:yes stop_codon:yes gene_type:complete